MRQLSVICCAGRQSIVPELNSPSRQLAAFADDANADLAVDSLTLEASVKAQRIDLFELCDDSLQL